MWKHYWKIMWKRKLRNSLLLLELLVSFLVVAAVVTYLSHNYRLISSPLGFETEDRYVVVLQDNFDRDSLAYAHTTQQLILDLQNEDPIAKFSFGNAIYPFSKNQWTAVSEVNNVSIRYFVARQDEDYLQTMGLTLAAGRWLEKPLDPGQIREVVVNQKFIDQNFYGRSMIDSIVRLGEDSKIVGVIENYKYDGEFSQEEPIVIDYVAPTAREAECLYLQLKPHTSVMYEQELATLLANTRGNTAFTIKKLEHMQWENKRSTYVTILAMSALALFLIINVALGIFGILTYHMQRRRSEISLRKAVGASNGDILNQFIFEAQILAFLAVSVGVILWIQIPVFGLWALDSDLIYRATVCSILFILVMVAACAVYPAWRASRYHPALGLKDE